MERKTKTLIAAVAAVATGSALAATPAIAEPAVPVAHSYAELLDPIPNASARLRAADAAAEARPARIIPAQYYHHHHHHHHHSGWWYRRNGYYWHGGAWVLRQHHHHHHHHSHDRYGY